MVAPPAMQRVHVVWLLGRSLCASESVNVWGWKLGWAPTKIIIVLGSLAPPGNPSDVCDQNSMSAQRRRSTCKPDFIHQKSSLRAALMFDISAGSSFVSAGFSKNNRLDLRNVLRHYITVLARCVESKARRLFSKITKERANWYQSNIFGLQKCVGFS